MNVLKKITGWFLFLFAGCLSLALLMSSLNAIVPTISEFKESTASGLGYLMGSLLVICVFALLIKYIAKLGLKMIKSKVIVEDSIDDIGAL